MGLLFSTDDRRNGYAVIQHDWNDTYGFYVYYACGHFCYSGASGALCCQCDTITQGRIKCGVCRLS